MARHHRYRTSPWLNSVIKGMFRPAPNMPPPLLTFDGINRTTSGCNCAPPDTHGDVGPNHYIQDVNVSFKVFDKNGNTLSGPTTYNSLFAPWWGHLAAAQPGDPFVFYDHLADRWVVSDFAFASFPGTHSINASPFPRPATRWQAAGFSTPCNRSDKPGWRTRRWRCGIIRSLVARIILRQFV